MGVGFKVVEQATEVVVWAKHRGGGAWGVDSVRARVWVRVCQKVCLE